MPKTGLEPVRICGSQDFKSCASANSATSAFLLAPRVGLEPTTYRLTAGCSTIELPRKFIRRRPTFPGSLPPSIISAEELNFRVRDGNGCVLFAIVTEYVFVGFEPTLLKPCPNNSAVSFTKISAPFGHIFWEFVAVDLPAIFQKKDSEKWG